jgi:hypothetical protein
MSRKKRKKNGTAGSKPAIDLTPKQFMRARRPERFSDSVASDEPILDRSILEYHLSTLTNRSQEVAFATFARHLAEREVCPNLLPQTGPTGGGDSKVDSETYPEADEIALGWYVGTGIQAASERWGFAFSAKKEWKDKAIADVDKAVATGRGYARVFFISNQFIRDKARAEVEDELREKHGAILLPRTSPCGTSPETCWIRVCAPKKSSGWRKATLISCSGRYSTPSARRGLLGGS